MQTSRPKSMLLKLMMILVMVPMFQSAPSTAAEQVVIWDSDGVTFSSPFTGGVIATSSSIANSPDLSAVKLFVEYLDVQHGGANSNVCPCEIFVVLQQIATGVWIPIANQFEPYRILDSSPKRILIYGPRLVPNPGVDDVIQEAGGGDIRISNTQGTAPTTMRVRVIFTEEVADTLTSVKLTAYMERFDG